MGDKSSPREQSAPKRLNTDWAAWNAATKLLKIGRYEQAAELLQRAQAATEKSGDIVLARLLEAACQICLAASQQRAEMELHARAYDGAIDSERLLQQQLWAIISLIYKREASDTMPPVLLHEHLKSVKRLSIWQRLQSLLGRSLSSLLQKREAPALSTAASTSSGEHIKALIAPPVMDEKQGSPSLIVYCFGHFQVYHDDQPVARWRSVKGNSIFKYLVAHREHPVHREVLMEVVWPGADPDAARNTLNVAIYNLRQTFREIRPDFSHVLFRDDRYLLNPELRIWVDVDEFMERFRMAQNLERRGDLTLAVREYVAAEALYRGEFLEEDRYDDWPLPQRQSLQDDYLILLDRLSRYYFDQEDYDTCAILCGKMVTTDPCREDAHRRLMHCYIQRGQRYLALRQYKLCAEALVQELNVDVSSPTRGLYEHIRQRQAGEWA